MKIKEVMLEDSSDDILIDKKDITLEGTFNRKLPSHVKGDLSIDYYKITSLRGCPQTVDGSFYCTNTKLTSLDGAPLRVGKNFDCRYSKLLESIVGAPRYVGRDFMCSESGVTSLEGAPKYVGGDCSFSVTKITSLEGIGQKFLNEIHGNLYLNGITLKSHALGIILIKGLQLIKVERNRTAEAIFNKHLKGDRDIMACQEELIDAGYEELAQL